jgi:hypothetical protein
VLAKSLFFVIATDVTVKRSIVVPERSRYAIIGPTNQPFYHCSPGQIKLYGQSLQSEKLRVAHHLANAPFPDAWIF